jgi:hypothetical protein
MPKQPLNIPNSRRQDVLRYNKVLVVLWECFKPDLYSCFSALRDRTATTRQSCRLKNGPPYPSEIPTNKIRTIWRRLYSRRTILFSKPVLEIWKRSQLLPSFSLGKWEQFPSRALSLVSSIYNAAYADTKYFSINDRFHSPRYLRTPMSIFCSMPCAALSHNRKSSASSCSDDHQSQQT